MREFYHPAVNISYLMLFTKLPQRWCNVVISTSERRCGFDIMVSKCYRPCRYNIRDRL